MKSGRVFALLAVCVGFAVALSGCTESTGASGSPTKPKASPAPNESADSGESVQLENAARVALGVSEVPTDDPLFVAMGFERTSDGVSAVNPLSAGDSYNLQIVCIEGRGSAKISVTGIPDFSIPCNGGAAVKRIPKAPSSLALVVKSVDGERGSDGMIGWRLTRLP